ncbi:MAG: septum site-determining protein MinC [Cyanothece sp. SIO1E1]|nr:septum site-determining protein MinC [Cyanothece sp. SIO1E1]
MTSESLPSASVSIIPQDSSEELRDLQVRFKSESGRLLLLLPSETSVNPPPLVWSEVWEQLKHRLNAGERFWRPKTAVHLNARDRLLDVRQLQAIAEALLDAQLELKRVYTSRRQTAVAAATAGYSVEQRSPVSQLNQSPNESGQALSEPLYLQTTIRSGVEIRHPGTVIVLGDVNPGGSVVAEGDILIWGSLRGIAHAGVNGNTQCRIMALKMQPTQIRIATHVARGPETPPAQYLPEVAHVTAAGIRIALATNFPKI